LKEATPLEQWAFFLLFADQYEPAQLRNLLPGVEFQQAVSMIEAIASKTEDRLMYDQREKAERDRQWLMEGMLTKGREEGVEKGIVVGKIQLLQQLLGEEPDSKQRLLEHSTDELTSLLSGLQQRLGSNGN